MSISRRHFVVSSGAFAVGFLGLRRLMESPAAAAAAGLRDDSIGLGPLVPDPARVLDLPAGFIYRIISRAGDPMDDGLLTPGMPDGMATFPGADGKTIIVRNHELEPDHRRVGPFGRRNERLDRIDRAKLYDPGFGRTPALGGTSTLVYDTRTGELERHFLSLAGTTRNCAGGPTPWGTWLTCEEDVTKSRAPADRFDAGAERDHGYVFEVPASEKMELADPRPIRDMGRFYHEAVAVDPATGIVYLTEDRSDGLLYRFIPRTPGDLHAGGRLQALAVADLPSLDTRNWGSRRAVEIGQTLRAGWIDMDNLDSPKDDLRDRGFKAGAARFARGEGMWYAHDAVYFCCTNGGRAKRGQIWRLTPGKDGGDRLELFVEPNDASVIDMCDNISVAPWGDLVVCEDGDGANFLLGVTPGGEVYRIARVAAGRAEIAGATFSPDGTTLFLNIQQEGLTLAVSGPWRTSS